MIKSPDDYKGAWTEVIEDRLCTLYPGAIPIAGGDLNLTSEWNEATAAER
jgi:hypothetical protein